MLGTKKSGDGFSEDEPYPLTITGKEARQGVNKSITTYDKRNKVYLKADLQLPGKLLNGQLLEMYADGTKLYVVVKVRKKSFFHS